MVGDPSGVPFEKLPAAYFEAVGKAATAFGMVEDGLEGLFNVTLQSAVPIAAKAILNAGTFDSRTKLVTILAELTLDAELLPKAQELVRRARGIGHRRNALVHGRVWNRGALDGSKVTQSIEFLAGGSKLALEEIQALAADCMDLFEDLCEFAVGIRGQLTAAASETAGQT